MSLQAGEVKAGQLPAGAVVVHSCRFRINPRAAAHATTNRSPRTIASLHPAQNRRSKINTTY